MTRLGRNKGGYFGETIDLPKVLQELSATAHRRGWKVETLSVEGGLELMALTRSPSRSVAWAPRIYISAGIHGDEPAGPLALQRLLQADACPDSAWFWCCPCLNPTGFARNTRAAASGLDLNRDYRHRQSAEIRAHVAWLQRLPMFDVTFCLHEDWEAAGFYVYELNPTAQPSLAEAILEAVREVCPIDLSVLIDGREAQAGLIRPSLDPAERPEWPEALYLVQNKTRQSYTLEAPSDFALETRIAALEVGLRAALRAVTGSPPPRPPDGEGPPPP
jgi:hypothetical protein